VITEKQFGRTVPPGGDIVCEAHACFVIQNSCEPKIANSKIIVLRVDEQVFWLDVSVDNVTPMTVLDGLQQLVNVGFDDIFSESVRVFFQNFEQILLQVFKNEVKPARFFETVNERHNVLLLQITQHLHFAQSRLLHDFIIVGLFKLLDSNDIASFFDLGLVNDTICTFANNALDFVLLHF